MVARSYASAEQYRFGYGKQEKDNDIIEGLYTAEYWQYDSRLGRRWNIDPMSDKYPWQSPYSAFNNSPIIYTDRIGLYGTQGEAEDNRQKAKEAGLNVGDVTQSEGGDWVFTASRSFKNGDNFVFESITFSKATNFTEYKQVNPNAEGDSDASGDPSEDVNLNAARDLSPISTYNNALRLRYINKAKSLFPLYDNSFPGNPSNQLGLDSRAILKTQTRNWSIGGAGKMLDLIEPIEAKPLINPSTGNVTRFYSTRSSINWLSRGATTAGAVGVGLTAIRIATADDKLREATLISGGMTASLIAMSISAPYAAGAGVAVSPFITPLGGIIVGGVVQLGVGTAAAIGGEWATGKILFYFGQ